MKPFTPSAEAPIDLLVIEEVPNRGQVGVERSPQHTHVEIQVPVGVHICKCRNVVTARDKGVFDLEGKGLAEKNRLATRSSVLQVKEASLEEVAPKEVEISVVVHIGECHGVRTVQTPRHRRHDLDALETILDEPEQWRTVRRGSRRLVTADGPVHPPQEEIPVSITVDVVEAWDVLAVGEQGLAVYIAGRITYGEERSHLGRAFVPKILHVAERTLCKQIEVAIRSKSRNRLHSPTSRF